MPFIFVTWHIRGPAIMTPRNSSNPLFSSAKAVAQFAREFTSRGVYESAHELLRIGDAYEIISSESPRRRVPPFSHLRRNGPIDWITRASYRIHFPPLITLRPALGRDFPRVSHEIDCCGNAEVHWEKLSVEFGRSRGINQKLFRFV